MQLPDIQFATTSDGVTIAYWSVGEGVPLILTHNFSLSHAELEWTVPSIAAYYRRLAERYRLIRFNPRHSGLSETGDDLDMTLTGMGRDLTAVADAAGADRFILYAIATMGPVAIEFAAAHPDRVSALILCDTYATVVGSAHAKWIEAQSALARVDGAKMAASLLREVTPPDEVEEVVALATHAGGPDLADLSGNVLEWDAAGSLEQVQAPALVIVGRNSTISELSEGRRMATQIPAGQMKSIGGSFLPYYADHGETLDAIVAFLGTGDQPTGVLPARGFTTIVFTDLVASTELMNRLGDLEGRTVLRSIERRASDLATKNGGEVVKYTGDGAMVAFPSTSGALSFAIDFQRAMDESPLGLRIGMATGEPLAQDGDLHGAVVHLASRIADQGDAGEIMVADTVRQLALGKGFEFEAARDATLKGFNEPVRLWKVTGRS